MKKIVFFMTAVMLIIGVTTVWGVPVIKQLPFSKTTNLTPATYTFKFSLWDAYSNGAEVWSEEKGVKMTSKTLKTNLGTLTPLDTVDFSQQFWVQVERNDGGIYTVVGTRTRLALAPYALWSETSEVTGPHTHDAVDVIGGTLNNSYFSAYSDLSAEGYLDNNSGTDLLTRTQADARYINGNQETDPQVGTLTNGKWCSTDGSAVNCVQEPPAPANHNHNSSYVNVTGDKMSGVLNLPLDGLIAGEDQLVLYNGEVGIGTPTPKDDLHVLGPSYLQAIFESKDSSGGIALKSSIGQQYELQSLNDGGFILYDRNDSRYVLKVNTAGNVGIGTLTPQQKLDVNGQVRAKSAYGDYIALGGDNVNDDVEITIFAPANRNKVSLWNGQLGTGVKFQASEVSADNNGGQNSKAIYGKASSTGDVVNYGGYFESTGKFGIAVFGYASHTGTDAVNYGGYFQATGEDGTGVYGEATGENSSGIVGWGSGIDCTGVYGHGTAKGGYFITTNLWGQGVIGEALGQYAEGVIGRGGQYDFYADGSGANYGPFTGSHDVKLSNDFPLEVKQGMIVSVTGETQIRKLDDGKIDISSTLPTIKLSSKLNDKAVFGAFLFEVPLHKDHWYMKKEGERFGVVNALGEGRVWVSNINGNIETGDYITTSVIPGYGQRQNDDLLHNYTLGKATENVDWDSVTETVEFKGKTYKVHLIAVVYTSG
jgi:hypothetical protein